MKGIALKVTYNDGGANGSLFGFRGTCSNQNMLVNVRDRRMTNCSDEGKPCREFVDANFNNGNPLNANNIPIDVTGFLTPTAVAGFIRAGRAAWNAR